MTTPRALASYRVTFGCAALAGLVNLVLGPLLAWVLVRYRFPGRKLIDALVDLPFALPTAVAGITLTALYASNGWLGRWLEAAGYKVAYTPTGITVALIFVSLPFLVRSVQPVLEQLEPDIEEAAATLGAGRLTTLYRVILPTLWPAILTGFALAFARAVGEYGSVIFIAGNLPMVSEIAPLLIVAKLDAVRLRRRDRDRGRAAARLVRGAARDQPAAALDRASLLRGGAMSALRKPSTALRDPAWLRVIAADDRARVRRAVPRAAAGRGVRLRDREGIRDVCRERHRRGRALGDPADAAGRRDLGAGEHRVRRRRRVADHALHVLAARICWSA